MESANRASAGIQPSICKYKYYIASVDIVMNSAFRHSLVQRLNFNSSIKFSFTVNVILVLVLWTSSMVYYYVCAVECGA